MRREVDGYRDRDTKYYNKLVKKFMVVLGSQICWKEIGSYEKYKRNVWLKFFKTELKGVWVVTVNASQDYVNVKLGEEYGFPRGFHIVEKRPGNR